MGEFVILNETDDFEGYITMDLTLAEFQML
jgi:hypothetical protein